MLADFTIFKLGNGRTYLKIEQCMGISIVISIGWFTFSIDSNSVLLQSKMKDYLYYFDEHDSRLGNSFKSKILWKLEL